MEWLVLVYPPRDSVYFFYCLIVLFRPKADTQDVELMQNQTETIEWKI